MRYAAAYKPDSEPLGQFVRRKGGINLLGFPGAWAGVPRPERRE
jgi:hypothetical protein